MVRAFCLSEPSDRFISFASLDTGVLAFECALSNLTSDDVYFFPTDLLLCCSFGHLNSPLFRSIIDSRIRPIGKRTDTNLIDRESVNEREGDMCRCGIIPSL